MPVEEFGYVPEAGTIDLEDLDSKIDDFTAAVIVQSPNFFGIVDQVRQAAEFAHRRGALFIVVFTEAVSLGLLEPPSGADIVAGELQSFAIAPSYGGPYAGVIATREKYVRQMPGRLVGQTVDTRGNRAFCLTLATREQHIRREKATSNICTNQALLALMARIGGAESGKSALPGGTPQAAFLRKILQRICGEGRGQKAGPNQPGFTEEEDRWRFAVGPFLSRTGGFDAAVCH
jgi:glycine dehydrogenase subunit 1